MEQEEETEGEEGEEGENKTPLQEVIDVLVRDHIEVRDDATAVYSYTLGKTLRGLGLTGQAMRCFQGVVDGEAAVGEETYLVPHSLCELGELHLAGGAPGEARRLLHIARDRYKGYDFDKPLLRRVKFALERLQDREA
eukprot:jgi/Mesen1/1832/ME000142S00996